MATVHSPLMPSGGSGSSSNGANSSSSPRGKSNGASSSASSEQVSVDVRGALLPSVVAASDADADSAEDDQKSPKGSYSSSSVHAPAIVDDEEHREEFLRIARMTGYRFSWALEIRYWCACVASAFVVWLLALWFPDAMVPWRYKEVSLDDAELVQVVGKVHGSELIRVQELGQDVRESMAIEERRDEELERSRGGSSNSKPSATAAAQKRRGSVDLLHKPHRRGKMIIFRHMRYIYSPSARTFIMQQADVVSKRSEGQSIDSRHTSVAALKAKELNERVRVGLSHEQVLDNRVLYGENALVLEVPSIPKLLFTEVFHPFYVFQMYSVVLWCFEAYWIFAGAIAVIAIVSIVQTLVETRRRMTELAALARFDCPVQVLRNNELVTISSTKLVPGDIVRVSTGLLPCDLALLEGGAVVNESMLTGESVPVVKVNVQWPLNRLGDTIVPLTSDSRHTLFSATKILQLKPLAAGAHVYAVVVRTGFATTKGSLILSILYPQPSTFKFVGQSYKFIGALFSLALVGFAISVWQLKVVQQAALQTIIVRALDLITIVVPPSLPLALTVGTNFALMWLRDERIFCISPSRINMAGKVKLMCFDKTGTLTAESLEFMGVFPADLGASEWDPEKPRHFGKFQSPFFKISTMHVSSGDMGGASGEAAAQDMQPDADSAAISEDDLPRLADGRPAPDTTHSVPLSAELKVSMACCQSLAVMDGELIGDPLEQQTFEAAGATLQDTGDLRGFQQIIRVKLSSERTLSFGVREQFEFSSALARMSVLCSDLDSVNEVTGALSSHWAFVKGSPEAMEALCIASSVPSNFRQTLAYFAHQGYRVIAIARKRVKTVPALDKTELRRWVERDLEFLGLVLLENKLKKESEPTLQILRDAAIRCCMITGDNPLTAVTVAKDCKLVAPGTRVFQSMLVADAEAPGGHRLEWHDTDDESVKLDPLTLRLPRGLKDHKSAHHGAGETPFELAVTGPVFKMLQEMPGSDAPASHFHRVILNGQIFARMSPDQKAALVAELQAMGIYAGMCGDGANDCGALKTAHVGVSLSESEASIAAPFTYQRPNISCIPILLSEGRSSLVTSFQLFRYMAMYSMIQFGAVILTYFQGSVLGNWQYLYEDLWLVFPMTIFMGATRANRALSIKRPSGNLLSISNVANLVTHIAIGVACQVGVYETILAEPDYYRLPNEGNGPNSFTTTALYYFSNFQYVVMAVLFSLGRPWKDRMYTNWKFCACVLLSTAGNCALLFSPLLEPAFFRSDDLPLSWSWRRSILYFVLLFTGAATLFELWVFPLGVRLGKRLRDGGLKRGRVFGRPKVMEGPNAKLYHRMRGEFEASWKQDLDRAGKVY